MAKPNTPNQKVNATKADSKIAEKVHDPTKNSTKEVKKVKASKADIENAEKKFGELQTKTTKLFNNLQSLFTEAKEKLNKKNNISDEEEEKIMKNIGERFQKMGKEANTNTQLFKKIQEGGLIKQAKIDILGKKFMELQALANDIRKAGDEQTQNMEEKKEEIFMDKVEEVYENFQKTNSVIEEMEEEFGQIKTIHNADLKKKIGELKNNLDIIGKKSEETGESIEKQISEWDTISLKKLEEIEGLKVKFMDFVKDNKKE